MHTACAATWPPEVALALAYGARYLRTDATLGGTLPDPTFKAPA